MVLVHTRVRHMHVLPPSNKKSGLSHNFVQHICQLALDNLNNSSQQHHNARPLIQNTGTCSHVPPRGTLGRRRGQGLLGAKHENVFEIALVAWS